MPPLTTYTRTLHRCGLTNKDVDPSHVEEYIEDAQAIVESMAKRTFAITDSDYNLARAGCTDLAAFYCLVRILGGSYSGLQFDEDELNITAQQQAKRDLANKLLAQANRTLDMLIPKVALVAKASTS